jgi:hypothetical protein
MSARLRVVARSSRVDLIVDCIVIDVERCFVEDVCTRPVMDENAFASDVQVLGEARGGEDWGCNCPLLTYLFAYLLVTLAFSFHGIRVCVCV